MKTVSKSLTTTAHSKSPRGARAICLPNAKPSPIQLERSLVLFMVIERFEGNDMLPVYKRVRDEGRCLPEGLKYLGSWIEPNFARCFQLMECDDLRLLQEWALHWRGTGAMFEMVPVVESSQTREIVAPYLEKL